MKKIKFGTEFESQFQELLIKQVTAESESGCFIDQTGTTVDYFEGTDFEVYGIPVDVTSFYSGKKYTEYVTSINTKYGAINFGIKTGNNHVVFEKPVVVVGVDGFIKKYIDVYFEDIQKLAGKIIDTISDVFYDYCDEKGIEI